MGLEVTLENYAREFSRHFQIPVGFHSRGFKKKRLLPELELNLYRIAQEALNNIAKHAQATEVSVLLEKPDNHIVLIIEDNGVGFNLNEKVNRNKRLGLIGMNERAALVGGKVEIESSLGKGTTIYSRVPLQFTSEEES